MSRHSSNHKTPSSANRIPLRKRQQMRALRLQEKQEQEQQMGLNGTTETGERQSNRETAPGTWSPGWKPRPKHLSRQRL